MASSEISPRAQVLLKALVERHIRDGQPVGSKTLMAEAGLPVSAATIRNVLCDLEERGYLHSPHTSAGRVPTTQGYRLFVDTMLQVRPLHNEDVSILQAELNPDRSSAELVHSASSLLSSITAQAGVVTVPRQRSNQLRQVEFLPLSGNRVLVILVVNEREVQNRIIHTQRPYTATELHEATVVINQRFAGQSLSLVQTQIVREMREARSKIDNHMQAILDLANKALDQQDVQEEYLMAGEARLLDNASAHELGRLRELFEAFEQKNDLLHLLERCSSAEGVQIFIGEESGYEVFDDYSLVTSRYGDGEKTLGVLGVIGPTRMAYERVIPIVDVTARMLSAALSR